MPSVWPLILLTLSSSLAAQPASFDIQLYSAEIASQPAGKLVSGDAERTLAQLAPPPGAAAH